MKQRLDQILVERNLAESRSKAEALIMSGVVWVDGVRRDKPGFYIKDTTDVQIESPPQYVSRAGEKLASANRKFGVNFTDAVVLDVGSSTGGFTDYALQNGAARVYAVDVGKHQLHEKLHGDERVVVMEQTDIRDHTPALRQGGQSFDAAQDRHAARNTQHVSNTELQFEAPDIVTIDVSFISLRNILPAVTTLVSSDVHIIAMCKPQFEAGIKDATKHKGVIKNDRLRRDILKQFETWLKQNGFVVQDKADSIVKGAKGNMERFYLLKLSS